MWLGAVRAFAEASLVGGLADWFAVVALFRHPLGMRWIPHTAIIPKNKDRIGAGLADFVQNRFLTPEAIEKQLRSKKFAEGLAHWLTISTNSERVAATLAELFPKVLKAANDDDIRRFIRENIFSQLKEINLSSHAAALLKTFVDEGKHQQVLTQLLLSGGSVIRRNRDFIRGKVRPRIPIPNILWIKDSLADKVADGIVNGTIETLDEASKDPNHPLRRQFEEEVAQFIRDLETSDKYSTAIQEIRQRFFTSTGVSDFLNSAWQKFKSGVLAGLSNPDSDLRKRLVGFVGSVGVALEKDGAFCRKLDEWIVSSASSLARSHGHEIGEMIRNKFHEWDPTTAAQQLEEQVGDDLQFIRVNGAIVGGFVGVVLYFLDRFLPAMRHLL